MDPASTTASGWGISVAGWLVSSILTKLLTKGFSSLGLWSSDKAEKLEGKILQLKLMLEAAEDGSQRETLTNWIEELKSSFYAAEDILDAIDYHNLKSRILYQTTNIEEQNAETMAEVPIESKAELKEALDKLENLIDEGHKVLSLLKLLVSCDDVNNTPNNTVRPPTKTTSSPQVVFGRDGDLEIIRKFLRDKPTNDKATSSRSSCYSVMGIHGIPGSGKTTLAQYVCEKERDDAYFDLVMWIHVSQNFNVDTIFTEMLQLASGRKRDQVGNLDMLERELKAHLRNKMFLLVLDDVLCDKDANGQLNLLLRPLEVAEMGSRILMTSRTLDAARALGAQNLIAISDLEEEQFYSMFMHYALDGVAIENEVLLSTYHSIGRKIAEKLGRSPLAARIVAGQLKRRLDLDYWRCTVDTDLLNNETWAALLWSYQQLDEHVKRCFTYCSMFPRRHELQRDELVHLWMAEGFVKASYETEDVEHVGQDYFHVLLSTSFIQLHKTEFGKEYFKIHDMLYELARRIAGNDCFIIEKGMVGKIPQDVRHLYILSYDERVFREQILNLKSLCTLIISSYSRKSMRSEDFRSMLKSLKKLRVAHLEVDSLSTISPCIGGQKHLRYLCLFGKIAILTLPRKFTVLYNLQKFAVRPTTSVNFHFSEEIAKLVNLRYMICRVFDCPNIGRLTLLQTLSVFRVCNASCHEIKQLEHLNNLHGTLRIERLENVTSKEEAFQAKLVNKVHLSDLDLHWNTDDQSFNMVLENQNGGQSKEADRTASPELAEQKGTAQSSGSQEILDALRLPHLIRSLKIMNYSGSAYPNWFLREEGALENLQYLELSNCYAQPKIGESVVHLRTLKISSCRWHSLPENMERLERLEKLIIYDCKNITSLQILPPSLKVLTLTHWSGSCLPQNMEHLTPSLEELNLHTCDNILSLPRLPLSLKKLRLWTGSSLPEDVERLTSLEELTILRCNNIPSLPSLPLSIKKLEIYNCGRSLAETCLTEGHPNWQKIAHIREKHICPC